MEKTFPLFWIPLLPLLGAAFNLLVDLAYAWLDPRVREEL